MRCILGKRLKNKWAESEKAYLRLKDTQLFSRDVGNLVATFTIHVSIILLRLRDRLFNLIVLRTYMQGLPWWLSG